MYILGVAFQLSFVFFFLKAINSGPHNCFRYHHHSVERREKKNTNKTTEGSCFRRTRLIARGYFDVRSTHPSPHACVTRHGTQRRDINLNLVLHFKNGVTGRNVLGRPPAVLLSAREFGSAADGSAAEITAAAVRIIIVQNQ